MSNPIQRYSRPLMVALAATAALVLAVMAATTATAAATNPKVLPPESAPYGMSYGEWSAEWWQQAMADGSGPFEYGTQDDPAEVDCAALGTSQVAFLVGTNAGGEAYRSCTIAPGRALLIPLVNAECSTVQGDGETEADLRQCAAFLADNIDTGTLHASVDGRDITGLEAYRFDSALFQFAFSSDNPFGIPADATPNPSDSVADGYWIMLAPLPAGSHTVNFGGGAFCDGGECLFTTEATYKITVAR